jgi:hypothetical protein
MKLQNGYKVIYEKIADRTRTFFADRLDGTAADQLGDAFEIGKYKLIFEKDSSIFGSATGKIEDGVRIKDFDQAICAHVDKDEDNVCDKCEVEVPATYASRTRKSASVEEPTAPAVEENEQTEE